MATKVVMPTLGLTMKEGLINTWLVNEGDEVSKGDPVVEISSEKLNSEVEAPESGVVLKIVAQEGDEVPVKEALAYIGEEGEEISDDASDAPSEKEPDTDAEQSSSDKSNDAKGPETSKEINDKDSDGERIFITPIARKMAEEQGIDISDVNGTGGNGRITKLDIERYEPQTQSSDKETVASVDEKTYGEGLEGMRKTIAQRMMRSVNNTAQVTNQLKIDVTKLMAFRQEIKDKVNQPLDNGEISINTLVTRAVVLALKEHQDMNAWYYNGEYTKMDEIHIGMATDMDEGLVVPVIKNAENMPLSQLGPKIREVTSKARKGTLEGDLYAGSTFSITNLGGSGIEYFTPIINTPEVAILGVGAIQKELAFNEGKEVVEKLKLPLSLTYDHQIIDGAPAARFMNTIESYLSDPYRLIL